MRSLKLCSLPVSLPTLFATTAFCGKRAQDKRLALNDCPESGFQATLSFVKRSRILRKRGSVEFHGCSQDALKRKLIVLSATECQNFLKQTFFISVVHSSDGTFKVKLMPQLKGGGGICCKQADDKAPLLNEEAEHSINAPQVADLRRPCISSQLSPSIALLRKPTAGFESTRVLATTLKIMSSEDSTYSSVEKVALNALEEFAQKKVKTKALIEEASALALAQNPTVSRMLLKILIQEIEDSTLLDIDILKALYFSLENSPLAALDPDDLVRILTVTVVRIKNLHRQDNDVIKLQSALQALSGILDIMGDSNVIGLNRINLHDPLYQILDQLSEHDNISVAAEASYAKQALVRVPSDESKLSMYLRRGVAAAKGFVSIAQAVWHQDPSRLIAAYENFKEAHRGKEDPSSWYEELRLFRLLIATGDISAFKNFAFSKAVYVKSPAIAGGLINTFSDSALEHPDLDLRKKCIDSLVFLFLEDAVWGTEKKVKRGIVHTLIEIASHHDEGTRIYARDILKTLSSQAKSDQQRGLLDALLPDNIDALPLRPAPAQVFSTELLSAAQSIGGISLEQLRADVLQDDEINKELAAYIPVLATREIFSKVQEVFDLEKAFGIFLRGQKNVFLLLGDSGGGKSTFCRYIERKLWQEWRQGSPIPLFIPLSGMQNPFGDVVIEALSKRGFTQQQIQDMRRRESFVFFFDGYDELGKYQNFYTSNNLGKWKAKVVITCRTQYLSVNQATYRNYFTPPHEFSEESHIFEESALAPFTPDQIASFLKKYVTINPSSWRWEQYDQTIRSIPGLSEMIATPFLLRITAEVLPGILKRHEKKEERLSLAKIDLYDAFIERWFARSEQRLMAQGHIDGSYDIKDDFLAFCKQLAVEMLKAGIVAVEYREQSSFSSSAASDKWAQFFSTRDRRVVHIRSGVPIRKVGPSTYVFIHKSLLEYFGARSAFEQSLIPAAVREPEEEKKEFSPVQSLQAAPSSNMSYLESTLMTKEPEVIGFLAEYVRKNKQFEEKLSAIIESSKNDPSMAIAAANAISIFVAAKIPLSRRNFRGVRISGADLSYAILDGTDFSGADMWQVKLQGAFLRGANLSSCQMQGAEFGQRPYLKCSGGVRSISVSRDGTLALLVAGGHAELWDYMGSKRILSLQMQPPQVFSYTTCAVISPDGKWGLSGHEDKTVRLWNLQTGQQVQILQGHIERVHTVAISPNGELALSASLLAQSKTPDFNIILWNLRSGQKLKSLQGHNHWVEDVVFSSDGKRALSGSSDRTVRLWDLQTGKQLQVFQGHTDRVASIAFSSDEKMALSGSWDGTVRLWDLQTGKLLHNFQGHAEKVWSVAFSPNRKWVLSGSYDQTVRLWDVQTGKQLRVFQGHIKGVYSVAFSPDEKWALSGSDDQIVRLWDLQSEERPHTLQGHTKNVKSVAIFPDRKWVLSGSDDQTLKLWDLQSGQRLQTLRGHTGNVEAVAISSDGKRALSGSEDKTVRLWDLQMGQQLQIFQGHTDEVHSVAFSPNGKWALSGSWDKTVRLWNPQTGQQLQVFQGHTKDVQSIAFSPDGNWVLSGSGDKTVRLWDLQSGQHNQTIQADTDVASITISSDGKWAVWGSWDRTIRLLDLQSKKQSLVFRGHTHGVRSVAISPDRKYLLSGSEDKTVRLWDLQTGQQLQVLQGHTSTIWSVAFSSDGKWAVSGSSDCSIKYWSLFDEKGALRPALIWSSHLSSLTCEDLNIENAQGLDPSQQTLLLQHGAIGKFANEDVPSSYLPESKMPMSAATAATFPHEKLSEKFSLGKPRI